MTDPAFDNAPITQLLRAWTDGQDGASNALADQVYAELHRIASLQLQRERRPQLEAAELVHEAWMRLGQAHLAFPTRQHFFAFAALQMRRLLVDLARSARARPGQSSPATLSLRLVDPAPQPADLAILGNALDQLDKLDARKSQAFALAELAGFRHEEVAEILAISAATLERDLRFARAWLASRMA
jgi:RNA polymerase sigma factor (TIGR02999 family)